eukprot:COSAG02_NODE_75_length_41389_cov_106.665762_22_plen_94_part_00
MWSITNSSQLERVLRGKWLWSSFFALRFPAVFRGKRLGRRGYVSGPGPENCQNSPHSPPICTHDRFRRGPAMGLAVARRAHDPSSQVTHVIYK